SAARPALWPFASGSVGGRCAARGKGHTKTPSYPTQVAWGHGRLRLPETACKCVDTSACPSIVARLRQAASDRHPGEEPTASLRLLSSFLSVFCFERVASDRYRRTLAGASSCPPAASSPSAVAGGVQSGAGAACTSLPTHRSA